MLPHPLVNPHDHAICGIDVVDIFQVVHEERDDDKADQTRE